MKIPGLVILHGLGESVMIANRRTLHFVLLKQELNL